MKLLKVLLRRHLTNWYVDEVFCIVIAFQALVLDNQECGNQASEAKYIWQAEEGKISPVTEITPPPIPEDLKTAIKSGKVRAPTHIISTISDDRG